MSRWGPSSHHTITLAEYRALGELERPVTDRPVGSDARRRVHDAACSAVWGAHEDHTVDPDLPRLTPGQRAKDRRRALSVARRAEQDAVGHPDSPEITAVKYPPVTNGGN